MRNSIGVEPNDVRPPITTQLEELYELVTRADQSTINWLYSHYDIDQELTTIYRTTILLDYFRYYDGKKRRTYGTS